MKSMTRSALATLSLSLVALCTPAYAEVELPSVFTEHLVLQRERPIPVWGRADVGEVVTVEFAGESATTIADADGRWSVRLPAQLASAEPRELVVSGQNRVVVGDVLVGEVWVCSGQSNMEWVVSNSNDAANEIAAGDYPRIRLFKAAHTLSYAPEFTVSGSWSTCHPDRVGDFSAVAYFFGRDLLRTLDVPIGLISTNWGGTRAEPWTAPAALATHSLYADALKAQRAVLAAFHTSTPAEREARYQEELAAASSARASYWKTVTTKDPGTHEGWYLPETEPAGWNTMKLPGLWEQADPELATYDGLVWFRHVVDVPEEWSGEPLQLELGRIDDSDQTYFNGTPVGATIAQHTARREYTVPAELVKAGRAVIAVLVYDTGGAGGFNGPLKAMQLRPGDEDLGEPISLSGSWNWRAGGPPQSASAPRPVDPAQEIAIDAQTPGAMYNAMIHPFVPYAMRGAIWYQGESNAGEPTEYRELLPLMINSWREAFGQGDFPFGIVQLASFKAVAPDSPVEGDWADLRDAQLHASQVLQNTGLVVASDIGDAVDIHPRNKQEVGRRLALWARATVYGERELEYSGPSLRELEHRSGELVLHFDHADGLKTRDGHSPAGFAIAGDDGAFVWAEARIEGATVVLSAAEVSRPTAARYGWCNNLEHLNLVNAADLPASPFRSDALR
jgi:sialate O-acetylesterase